MVASRIVQGILASMELYAGVFLHYSRSNILVGLKYTTQFKITWAHWCSRTSYTLLYYSIIIDAKCIKNHASWTNTLANLANLGDARSSVCKDSDTSFIHVRACRHTHGPLPLIDGGGGME